MTCRIPIWVFLLLSVPAGAHEFYVSITRITLPEDSTRIRVVVRMFSDDLNAALKSACGEPMGLATPPENETADSCLAAYLADHLHLRINDRSVPLSFTGKRYDYDATECRLQGESPPRPLESAHIENSLLMELFDAQTNIVRFRIDGRKQMANLNKTLPKAEIHF